MESWRQKIIDEALTWQRTPWVHHACIKGVGVDCGMFVIQTYANAGLITSFDPGHYSADWMLHRSEEKYLGFVETYLDQVDTPQPGDVVVWKFGRCFSHGAIVVDWPTIIHAYRPARGVIFGDAFKGQLADKELRFYSIAKRLK